MCVCQCQHGNQLNAATDTQRTVTECDSAISVSIDANRISICLKPQVDVQDAIFYDGYSSLVAMLDDHISANGAQTLVIEPEAVILNRVQGLGICTLSDHTAYYQSFEALDAHDIGL